MSRYAIQCRECGLWLATEDEDYVETSRALSEVRCPVCDSQGFVLRGTILRGRVTTEHDVPPCDERCTDAAGHTCTCRCGGVNHGTHRVVTIRRDHGSAPTITLPAALSTEAEKLRAQWREWVEVKDQAKALIKPFLDRISRREWLDRETWWAVVSIQRAINEARKLKTPRGRIRKVREALDYYKPILEGER